MVCYHFAGPLPASTRVELRQGRRPQCAGRLHSVAARSIRRGQPRRSPHRPSHAKLQFHHSAPACPSKVGAAFRRATPFQIPAKCIQWLPRTAPTAAERRLRSTSVLDDLCCQWQSHVPDSIAQLINTNRCPNTQATVCAGESAGESLTHT